MRFVVNTALRTRIRLTKDKAVKQMQEPRLSNNLNKINRTEATRAASKTNSKTWLITGVAFTRHLNLPKATICRGREKLTQA